MFAVITKDEWERQTLLRLDVLYGIPAGAVPGAVAFNLYWCEQQWRKVQV